VEHSGGGIGDKGYQGCPGIITPRKKPSRGELSKTGNESNAEIFSVASTRRTTRRSFQIMANLPHRLSPTLRHAPRSLRYYARTILLLDHLGFRIMLHVTKKKRKLWCNCHCWCRRRCCTESHGALVACCGVRLCPLVSSWTCSLNPHAAGSPRAENPHVRERSGNGRASPDMMGFFGGCARTWHPGWPSPEKQRTT
jgi:hypothetical protein